MYTYIKIKVRQATKNTQQKEKYKTPGTKQTSKQQKVIYKMAMTKTAAKEKAKSILQSAIGSAYYRLENESFSSEDQALILEYINKLGSKACKAINAEYVTY